MASIQNGWQRKPLGDVADVVSGYAFKSSEFGDRGIPVIKIKNIRVGSVDLSEADRVDEKYLAIPERYHVRAGDVLISLTGSHISQPNSVVGRVARHSAGLPHCLLNQRGGKVIVRDRNACDLSFVFYALSESETVRAIAMKAHGAANQANVSPTQVENVEIPLPPFPVQRRIAGILSAYDELIENSQRRVKILESMARALYREWFVHFRFPGHESVPRVPSPLGDIPQGWEVVSIDDVCARVTDGSHRSPQSVDAGMPMASSKDMHDWGLNLDTARLISPEDFADLVRNDCKPKKNDVLITKDGANYLKYIFVTRVEQEVVLLSSVAVLRPNARINPHLLAAILKEPENKGKLRNYVTGAAIPRVILKDFKRFQLLLPSKEVQTAWAKIAEPMTEQTWRLIDKIQNLRRTRDLLLPRLLSGQIDVEAIAS